MTLSPYPEYRESGVDWLGEIPAHWKLEPFFGEYEEKQVKNTGLIEKTVLSLSYGRIIVKSADNLRGLVPESFETYQIVESGDIIIRPTDLQNDHTSLRVGFSPYRGIITSAYICLRTYHHLSPEYGYQILNTFDLTKAIYGYGTGLRQNLSFGHLKRVRVPVPPPDEQAAIVTFLDAAEKRIRRYIRAKQKLIKLLNEQKQAIIQQAVTRGLHPDVPMRDSGIEWLGEIPAHWETVRLAYLVDLKPGYAFSSGAFSQNNTDIRLLRGVNVSPEGIRWKSVVYWSGELSTYLKEFELEVGDIVMGMDRPVISSGTRVAVVQQQDIPALLLQRVARIRVKQEIRRDYLMLLLVGKLFSDYLAPIFTGISVPHVSGEQIESFRVALPPVHEQEEIIDFTNYQTVTLDQLVEVTKEEIAVIQEYRTRLIADVVTGKIDVRGIAFQMPEAFDETDAFDSEDDEALEEDTFEETNDAEDEYE